MLRSEFRAEVPTSITPQWLGLHVSSSPKYAYGIFSHLGKHPVRRGGCSFSSREGAGPDESQLKTLLIEVHNDLTGDPSNGHSGSNGEPRPLKKALENSQFCKQPKAQASLSSCRSLGFSSSGCHSFDCKACSWSADFRSKRASCWLQKKTNMSSASPGVQLRGIFRVQEYVVRPNN